VDFDSSIGLQDNMIMKYVASGTKWTPTLLTLDLCTDVDTTTNAPTDLQSLVYDGVTTNQFLPTTLLLATHLGDVTITAATSGEFLRYDGTSSKFVNSTAALEDLSNVSSGATSGQTIVWNGSAWTPTSPTLAASTDLTLTSLASADLLVYNGSAWVNQKLSANDLTDVTVSSASNLDVLIFNSTSSVFVNRALVLDDVSNVDSTGVVGGNGLYYDSTTSTWKPTSGLVADIPIGTATQDGVVAAYDVSASKFAASTQVGVRASNAYLSPSSTDVPSNLGELCFRVINNTTVELVLRGSDSVDRTVQLTLA